jgi:hypothetical protein
MLLLAILVLPVPAIAAEPLATVTGRKDGKDLSYQDGQDTIGLGMVVSVFGSARLEYAATKERWDAARQRDHVRVRFSRPTSLATQLVDPGGKRYAVDEILVRTKPGDVPPAAWDPNAGWGSSDTLLARCGEKYYSFSKYEGALTQLLIQWFGPAPPVRE